MTFRVVSTFSGCGGSSLGYKMAGAEVVAAVEWDDHAVQCYRANHPTTKIFHGDISDTSGEDILAATGMKRGELDLLDGSPPCQGFSTAGKRVLDDERNSLFREHLRLVDELNPRNVVIENVSGMIKGKMRVVASEIVSSLKSRGYKVAAGLMEAQYFGVPQLRPRVFFIASRVGVPSMPRPTSPPIPCRIALRGVDPGPIPLMTSATARACAHLCKPGENGQKMLARMRPEKSGWFNWIKLDPDRPSPTLIKMSGMQFHWECRPITIPEALVLTGFPVDYKLPPPPGCTERQAYGMPWMRIGNSVAPPMTREIAKQVFMRMD